MHFKIIKIIIIVIITHISILDILRLDIAPFENKYCQGLCLPCICFNRCSRKPSPRFHISVNIFIRIDLFIGKTNINTVLLKFNHNFFFKLIIFIIIIPILLSRTKSVDSLSNRYTSN